MNVLHIFHSYLATSENWIFRILENLSNIKVIVASKKFLRSNFYSSNFNYVEFPLKNIPNPQRILWVRIINRIISILYVFYPLFIINRFKDIDLVHSHFSFVGWRYRKLAKKIKVPHIISFYGLDYEYLPHQKLIWRKRYQKLFISSDHFLCEGKHGASILVKMGCPEKKIKVIHLGVDVDTVPFFQREKNENCLNLLQIAGFSPKKGHIYTLKAFHKALKDCPNMTLTFVGGGNRKGVKNVLIKYVNKNELEGKVEFLEQIEFEIIYKFMSEYHVFIHPSCYADDMDCEGGAPVVLLDAQATGMPVISTDHCDIPEEVQDNITGFLTPEKNIELISKSIQKFYFINQYDYDEFSKNARKHIEKYYNIKQTTEELVEFYKKVIKDYNK